MEQQPKQKRVSPLTLVLIFLIVLLAGAAAVLALGRFSGEEPDEEQGQPAGPTIGYEEGVTALDQESLQQAVDEMHEQAKRGGVPVEYQNDAYSEDGETVACHIANPSNAPQDIYIQIFADDALEDQLYLSKLIPPGKALQQLKLDHALEAGTHRVFVVYTQVEDDHATIIQQVIVTMDVHVEEE